MTTGSDFPTGDAVRLVMLDCDGVLFDSWRANVAFYNAVLTSAGVAELDDEGERLCHTLSSPQLYAHLFGSDPGLRERVTTAARTIDYGPFFSLMEPTPDLCATLTRLADHCPLSLATNRGRTVAGVIEHFELAPYFRVCVGVLDVAHPKPAPDLLLTCLDRLGVAARNAVYVGDTPLDRQAAAAANVPYVGVGPASEASTVINQLRELPELLAVR